MGKYAKIFSLAMVHSLKNYRALIGLSIFLITCLVIFAHIWKIAALQTGATNFGPDQLLWYIALNEWILVSIPDVHEDMEEDVRSGKLAYILPRPISYVNALFFEGLGTFSARFLVLGIVTFAFTWFRIGHFSFGTFALFPIIVITFFAGIVALLFRLMIGLSAFWLGQVAPLFWIWEKLLFTLGGLMLPLTVYPYWLQKIAFLTPFPAILGQRSALAIDFNLTHLFELVANLLFWALFAMTSLLILYRRGLRIVNVEGG